MGKTSGAAALLPEALAGHGDSSARGSRCLPRAAPAAGASASGSRSIGRFLNGSLEEGLSAERLRLSAGGGVSLAPPVPLALP